MTTASTFVFGLHAVTAFLAQHPARALRLLVVDTTGKQRLKAVVASARAAAITVETTTARRLDALSGQANHQGLLLYIKALEPMSEQNLLHKLARLHHQPLLLILDSVTDPHNLGACLRTAEAAGVDAVIVPKAKAAGLTPAVRRVASGAADAVPLVLVTNLARCLKQLRQAGVWLVGTASDAEAPLFQQSLTGPLAIVMGAEATGLRRLTRQACDFMVHIPMAGTVASLNVSVAAGVCLFEAVRQRQ